MKDAIGVVGPMTGPLAPYGAMLVETVERVFAEYRVVSPRCVCDDAGQPDIAETVARRLVARGVRAVIGHFNSACALRVAPLYAAARVPFLAPCSTHPQLLDVAAGWAFRYCGDDRLQVQCVLAWLDTRAVSPDAMAVMHDRSPYGCSLSDLWRTACSNAMDARFRDAPHRYAGRLFFGKYPNALHVLRQNVSDLGGLFITSDDALTPAYSREGGALVEGTYVVGPVEGHAALTALAARHLASCLDRDVESGGDLRTSLLATDQILIDRTGQRVGADYAMFQIHEGTFLKLEGGVHADARS